MLYLYHSITPNYNGTHFYYKNFSKFIYHLNNRLSVLYTEIETDKYTIYNGTIRVGYNNELTDLTYGVVTYMIDTNTNMAYHVKRSEKHTKYALYEVSLDLWASYIGNAKFKNINVRKSNRKIPLTSVKGNVEPIGIYDEIEATDKLEIEQIDNLDTMMLIAFVRVHLGTIGNDTMKCIAIPVRALIDAMRSPEGEIVYSTENNACEMIHMFAVDDPVNKIRYQVKRPSGEIRWVNEHDATLLKMYIVPSDCVHVNNELHAEGWSVKATFKYDALTILREPVTKEISLTIDPNYHYQIGTLFNGTEVNRSIRSEKISFHFIYSNTELKVYVQDGRKIADITNDFEILVSNRNDDQKTIADNIRTYTGIFGKLINPRNINPARLIGNLGSVISDIMDEVTPKENIINNIGTGIGFLPTFYKDSPTEVNNPFKLLKYKSLKDEKVKARVSGVNYNVIMKDITNIFDGDLLGTGEPTDDTYLICNTDISNIPTNAIDVIENKLRTGIYLQYLS